MGRPKFSGVTSDQMLLALHTLTCMEKNTIARDHGRIDKILSAIDAAFRVLDHGRIDKMLSWPFFKKPALQKAFSSFDKAHNHKFSKAAKKSPEEWGADSHKAIRNQLSKENKRQNAQRAYYAAKAAKEKSEASEPEPEAPQPGAEPAALPMVAVAKLTGRTKKVSAPEEVDDAVLAAAIEAALRVQTVKFGGLTVSRHMPAPSQHKGKGKGIDQEVADKDANGDEEEADEKQTSGKGSKSGTSCKKQPSAAQQKRPASTEAGPVAKRPAWAIERTFSNGWVVKAFNTNQFEKKRLWVAPTGRVFKKRREAVQAGFEDAP